MEAKLRNDLPVDSQERLHSVVAAVTASILNIGGSGLNIGVTRLNANTGGIRSSVSK